MGEWRRAWTITQRRRVIWRERKRIPVHTLGVVLEGGDKDNSGEEESSDDYSEEESDCCKLITVKFSQRESIIEYCLQKFIQY